MKKERRFAGKAKCIGAAGLAGCLLLGVGIQADAATLKDVFDEHYYADRYKDLKDACGYDREALWTHFVTLGLKEGRCMNGLLDVANYRKQYADLNEIYGDNWDAYLEHYLTAGAKEGRDSGTEFDALYYAGQYEDLQKAYGDDILALWQHYNTVGAAEGREACKSPEASEPQTPLADSEDQAPPADSEDQAPPADSEDQTPPADSEDQAPPADSEPQTPPAASEPQGSPAGDASVDVGTVAVGASEQESEYAYRVLEIMNRIRAENGLGAFSVTQELMNTAQLRAKEISAVFSHTRPDGSDCFTAYRQNGINYRAAGENIAYASGIFNNPETIMEGWMNSPGHRANILNGSYNHVGIGCFLRSDGYGYWSQNFTD